MQVARVMVWEHPAKATQPIMENLLLHFQLRSVDVRTNARTADPRTHPPAAFRRQSDFPLQRAGLLAPNQRDIAMDASGRIAYLSLMHLHDG